MALPRRHQILNNQTLNGAGNSGTLPNLGRSENPTIVAILDIAGPVTGGGTLTINIYSQVNGGRPAIIGTLTQNAQLPHPARSVFHDVTESQVYVDWTVTGGASPSFGGVSLDLIFSSPDA